MRTEGSRTPCAAPPPASTPRRSLAGKLISSGWACRLHDRARAFRMCPSATSGSGSEEGRFGMTARRSGCPALNPLPGKVRGVPWVTARAGAGPRPCSATPHGGSCRSLPGLSMFPVLVLEQRSLVPGSFPELVDHIQVLIGPVVPGIVFRQCGEAEVAGRVLLGSGHDVPRDAPVGDVVQRGSCRAKLNGWFCIVLEV